MSYTRLILARHGRAPHVGNTERIVGRSVHSGLNADGESDADELGRRLLVQGINPDLAHASPIPRAMLTIQRALKVMSSDLIVLPDTRLAEHCLGRHEGMLRTDVYTPSVMAELAQQGANYCHPGQNPEGLEGESQTDVINRMLSYAASLRAGPEAPAIVLAGSHQTAIKALVKYIQMGGPNSGPQDPVALNQAIMGMDQIHPCTQTDIIIDGGPDPATIHYQIDGDVGR